MFVWSFGPPSTKAQEQAGAQPWEEQLRIGRGLDRVARSGAPKHRDPEALLGVGLFLWPRRPHKDPDPKGRDPKGRDPSMAYGIWRRVHGMVYGM